jgi:2-polyprenyl-3-methyl-5-hydroxy-6-metoxy-1,4-benzoquinol methylase
LVMLNVLEHIEDDVLALQNAFKLLKPGGSLVIEVPAGQYLYDTYDAQLHHFRRYSASGLRSKLTQAGFTVSRKSHLGFLLFPAFAAVKLLNKLRGQSKTIVHDQATSTSSSALVAIAMKLEAKLLNLFSLPYGIRLLMTAKRDA